MTSHVAQMMRDKLFAILFMRGKKSNGVIWYVYLSVRADRMEDLLVRQKAGKKLEPTEFGLVLAQGEGMPSDEVRAFMEQEYGFSHDDYLNLMG